MDLININEVKVNIEDIEKVEEVLRNELKKIIIEADEETESYINNYINNEEDPEILFLDSFNYWDKDIDSIIDFLISDVFDINKFDDYYNTGYSEDDLQYLQYQIYSFFKNWYGKCEKAEIYKTSNLYFLDVLMYSLNNFQ